MRVTYLPIALIATILLLSYVSYAAVGPPPPSGGNGGGSSGSTGSSGGSSIPSPSVAGEDKCKNVVCEEISSVCADGFVAICKPSCNATTGACGECAPDCTGHEKAKAEANLKCSQLGTVRERIKCRVNLPEENELNYLPEECRALTGLSTARCVTNYQTVQRCFQLENDVARVSCAKKNLVLGRVAEEKSKCTNTACLEELRTKVFDVVKFRIYNLEYKAQELKEKGVDENLILNFITSAEQKKIDFNNAQTIAEKKQIVRDVISLWKDFVSKAKEQVKR